MREVVQVHGGLDDIAPGRAGSAQHFLEILHHPVGLLDDPALDDLPGHGVERDLTGGKNEAVADDSLRIWSDR
jgi:hypothetical protein